MSVNVRALTITGIIVAAVSYAVCALFVALAPDTAATIGSYSRAHGSVQSWTDGNLGRGFYRVRFVHGFHRSRVRCVRRPLQQDRALMVRATSQLSSTHLEV